MTHAPTDHRPEAYRTAWQAKPVLREIYRDFYERIRAETVPGRSLEIGGGSGNLKEYLPDVVSTDVLAGSWLDALADAQHLPFRSEAFDNIVLVDVLHHLEDPAAFFNEAQRVLRPGGRVVMIEPAITLTSTLFYRFVHQEPVAMRVDPLSPVPHGSRDPFDSNQAIPTLLFSRRPHVFTAAFPRLEISRMGHLSLFAYPLSGGFKPWSLMPAAAVRPVLALERKLERRLGRFIAFRLMVTLTYNEQG